MKKGVWRVADSVCNGYLSYSGLISRCGFPCQMPLLHAEQTIPKSQLHIKFTHGVMILVKKHLPILDHIHIEENNDELVLAIFFSHETEVAILSLYAAPHTTFSNIVHVIFNALTHLHLNEPIVLVGDFNIDMLQNNGRTKELENYMCKYSLRILMNNTVHLQNALIDHVWSNVPIPQYRMFVLDTYWSDHDTIGIALEL
jgi:hypothetical protein